MVHIIQLFFLCSSFELKTKFLKRARLSFFSLKNAVDKDGCAFISLFSFIAVFLVIDCLSGNLEQTRTRFE